MRVLFIEDDYQLGKAVNEGLNQEFAADWFQSSEDGQVAIEGADYDVVVLDINLPKMSGIDWLKLLRKNNNKIPVLLLTARDTIAERVAGLDAGADDYLVKPFDFEELLARIRALSRRGNQLNNPIITFKNIELDTNLKTVSQNGKNINLSPLEFDILHLLIKNTCRAFSKEQITDKVYNWDGEVESNTIEVHISAIRRKLGKDLVKTIRNVGYLIENE